MEAGQRGFTGLGAHPTAQDHRVLAALAECAGEPVEVGDPFGEDQAVPPALQSFGDIVGDLPGAGLVGDQVPVDRDDPARR
jgi:hypothetical protein